MIGVLDDVAIGGVSGLPEASVYLPDGGQAAFLSIRVNAAQLQQALAFLDRSGERLRPRSR